MAFGRDDVVSTPAWFAAILAQHKRVAISGGPRAGKSTLAATVTDRPVLSTDEFVTVPWDSVPRAVLNRAADMGDSWVIEGVQVARALRKGLKPDVVVHLNGAHGELEPGQAAMAKGAFSVLTEWVGSNAISNRIPIVVHEAGR